MTKLVRDKIPQIIVEAGKNPVTHIASQTEYYKELRNKLQEEVTEFLEDDNKEELADILEVIRSICKYKKYDFNEVEEIRNSKAEKRGSFDDMIILKSVEEHNDENQ